MLIYIYIRPFGVCIFFLNRSLPPLWLPHTSSPKVHLKAVVSTCHDPTFLAFLSFYLFVCLSNALFICSGISANLHWTWKVAKDERERRRRSENTNCRNWFDCVLNLMFMHIRIGIKVNLCFVFFSGFLPSDFSHWKRAFMSIDELRCLITQMIHKRA